MVLIAASMGLRFGEIVDLRWKHVDFDHHFVTLEKIKNGDNRFVPIPEQVLSFLQTRQGASESFVFPSKDAAHRYAYSLIRKAFQSVLRTAGIADFRFHDLRHTAASHMAMSGATQGELMEVLGHRSPTMTRRYAHFSKEHIARVMQKTCNNLIGSNGESL
jgi:integrase